MKTSKWFYGLVLASFVSFTAAADNTSSTQTTGTTTVQNNLVITGSTGSNQGCKPAPKPVPAPDKTPTTVNGNVVNTGT